MDFAVRDYLGIGPATAYAVYEKDGDKFPKCPACGKGLYVHGKEAACVDIECKYAHGGITVLPEA